MKKFISLFLVTFLSFTALYSNDQVQAQQVPAPIWTYSTSPGTVVAFDYIRKRNINDPNTYLYPQNTLAGIAVGSYANGVGGQSVSTITGLKPSGNVLWTRTFSAPTSSQSVKRILNLISVPSKQSGNLYDSIYVLFDFPALPSYVRYRAMLNGNDGSVIWEGTWYIDQTNQPKAFSNLQKPLVDFDLNGDGKAETIDQDSSGIITAQD